MNVSMWIMFFIVLIAGGVGGAVNALMTDNGFLRPKMEKVDDKTSIFRPGYLGNVLIGAIAAVISWGLYGPLSPYYIIGTEQALAVHALPEAVGLTLASLVGAILIGIGGARWLTGEVDKNLLRAAAARAAASKPSMGASQQIAMATPSQALEVAKMMK
ncbi:MAG: hypothetical protein JW748_14650 [Anaerolineales bacterium]|nr:hypothetical protein [Anaerolineales bacterium]